MTTRYPIATFIQRMFKFSERMRSGAGLPINGPNVAEVFDFETLRYLFDAPRHCMPPWMASRWWATGMTTTARLIMKPPPSCSKWQPIRSSSFPGTKKVACGGFFIGSSRQMPHGAGFGEALIDRLRRL